MNMMGFDTEADSYNSLYRLVSTSTGSSQLSIRPERFSLATPHTIEGKDRQFISRAA